MSNIELPETTQQSTLVERQIAEYFFYLLPLTAPQTPVDDEGKVISPLSVTPDQYKSAQLLAALTYAPVG